MPISPAAVIIPLGILFFASGLIVNLIQVSSFSFHFTETIIIKIHFLDSDLM